MISVSDNWSWTHEVEFPSTLGEHLPFLNEVLEAVANLGWEGRDLFGIQMTLEETLTNAIRHGNHCDPTKSVRSSCKVSADRFWLLVEDQGSGYSLDEVPDCREDENLEATGGRGMMLIKAYMEEISFNEKGNQITVSTTKGFQPEEE